MNGAGEGEAPVFGFNAAGFTELLSASQSRPSSDLTFKKDPHN